MGIPCRRLVPAAPWGVYVAAHGVLEYRVLGTNFRDFAVVFTQLEFGDEAFNTAELYSEWDSVLAGWGGGSGTTLPQPGVGEAQAPRAAPLQVARRRPATRPCGSSASGATAWVSWPSSRPSCRRMVGGRQDQGGWAAVGPVLGGHCGAYPGWNSCEGLSWGVGSSKGLFSRLPFLLHSHLCPEASPGRPLLSWLARGGPWVDLV